MAGAKKGRFNISLLPSGVDTDLTLQQSLRSQVSSDHREANSLALESPRPKPEPEKARPNPPESSFARLINNPNDTVDHIESQPESIHHQEETVPINVLNMFQDTLSTKVNSI